MNVEYWAQWLKKRYPTANIVQPSVGELVAEVEPGFAVAVIEQSKPHFHMKTMEEYRIISGRLAVVVAGAVTLIAKDENLRFQLKYIEIPSRNVHFAMTIGEGPAVVEVISHPAWTKEDHFEV